VLINLLKMGRHSRGVAGLIHSNFPSSSMTLSDSVLSFRHRLPGLQAFRS
jgi:hypothetical protein